MSLQCPRCNSPEIFTHHQALKITATIGMLGGAIGGVSSALAITQLSLRLSGVAIPLNTISKVILRGLTCGVTGCLGGSQLGNKLDRHVLANNGCLVCGHRFNVPA